MSDLSVSVLSEKFFFCLKWLKNGFQTDKTDKTDVADTLFCILCRFFNQTLLI